MSAYDLPRHKRSGAAYVSWFMHCMLSWCCCCSCSPTWQSTGLRVQLWLLARYLAVIGGVGKAVLLLSKLLQQRVSLRYSTLLYVHTGHPAAYILVNTSTAVHVHCQSAAQLMLPATGCTDAPSSFTIDMHI